LTVSGRIGIAALHGRAFCVSNSPIMSRLNWPELARVTANGGVGHEIRKRLGSPPPP
jgi:hypothetical protein